MFVFVGVLSFILDPLSTGKTSFEGPFLEATVRVFQSRLVKYDDIQPTIYTLMIIFIYIYPSNM